MSELRFEVKDGVTNELSAIQRRLMKPQVLMSGIAAELLSLSEEQLDKEQDSDGKKWQKLAASTIKSREKRGHWPGKMLQVSAGGLAASITPFSSGHEAGLSVSKPYAAIHQFGGKAGRGRKVSIPAREYIPMRMTGSDLELTPKARNSILGLMRDLVDGKLG
jgi:phage virion morphogenesis protein